MVGVKCNLRGSPHGGQRRSLSRKGTPSRSQSHYRQLGEEENLNILAWRNRVIVILGDRLVDLMAEIKRQDNEASEAWVWPAAESNAGAVAALHSVLMGTEP